jgi:hypothetical protein
MFTSAFLGHPPTGLQGFPGEHPSPGQQVSQAGPDATSPLRFRGAHRGNQQLGRLRCRELGEWLRGSAQDSSLPSFQVPEATATAGDSQARLAPGEYSSKAVKA